MKSQRKAGNGFTEHVGILGWALVLSLVLVAARAWISATEVARVKQEVIESFQTGERTTYLLGHLGDQLALTQSTLRNAIYSNDKEVRTALTRFDRELAAALPEIPALLNPSDRAGWDETEGEINRLREEYGKSLAFLVRGNRASAARSLDRAAARSADVFDALLYFSRRNRGDVQALLRRTDQRIANIWYMEILLSVVLGSAVLAIWLAVIRILKRQRNLLGRYLAQVEDANRDLDFFAGRVAHDVKNALNPISLAARALHRSPARPDAVARNADKIDRLVRRANALMEGLLEFSKAEQMRQVKENTPVGQALQESLEEVGPLAAKIGARIEIAVKPGLTVACPESLLSIIFVNLMNNALKFMEGRQERVMHVEAGLESGQWAVMTVTDTGPGIPRESLPRLFEPFYRVPGTQVPGTGIGLATVQRIVRAHGGYIEVDSKPGEGSAFRIRLPVPENAENALQ